MFFIADLYLTGYNVTHNTGAITLHNTKGDDIELSLVEYLTCITDTTSLPFSQFSFVPNKITHNHIKHI